MKRNARRNYKNDYLTPSEASMYCGYSTSALRIWANEGKISCIRPNGGKRLYYLPDIKEYLGIKDEQEDSGEGRTILYARVSSSKQKPDLERQIEYLKERYPQGEVISDVGSGLNYSKRGLKKLLDQVASGDVGKIVVTYSDRLCRYGLELLEWIFREHSVELVVLCEETETGDTEEFAEDILDVCNYFVAKYNGKKAARYRKERQSSQAT